MRRTGTIEYVRNVSNRAQRAAASGAIGDVNANHPILRLNGWHTPGETNDLPLRLRGKIPRQAAADDAGHAGNQRTIARQLIRPSVPRCE